MTEESESAESDLDDEGLSEVEAYLRLYDDELAILAHSLERTERVVEGQTELCGGANDSGQASRSAIGPLGQEARVRFSAYKVLWDYVTRRPGTSGAGDPLLPDIMRHFQMLLNVIVQDIKRADELDEALAGLKAVLAPTKPGGATYRSGKKGRRPAMLTVYVRLLLQRRFPEWDGHGPFPGKNTQELRESLFEELSGAGTPKDPWKGFASHLGWAEAMEGGLFKAEEIDPKSGGPLFRMISNLQRMQ